jgi:ABC-type transport system involved in multi-copper enzyme maturation permease subunit
MAFRENPRIVLGPIFEREWLTIPRRGRHFGTRVVYLGTLWIISVTAWLSVVGWRWTDTLGGTARFGPLLFKLLTLVQLCLFLFFAALAAASAIAQEKDRRTFLLLLLTDLTNPEIVLGKVLGSLLPTAALLLATAPLLMFCLLLGGVSLHQVIQALVIVAATTLAAASLGGLIALWRDRTFQALALTVLCLVLYLIVAPLLVLPLAPVFGVDGETAQQWVDPFRALMAVQDPTRVVTDRFAPAYVYALLMLGLTLLLNGWGILRLRVWNPSGEPIMQRERPEDATDETVKDEVRARAHAAPGKARKVGANPILWREVFTRAYGRRPLLVKTAYALVLGLICWSALMPLVTRGERAPYTAAYGLIPVAVLSLLLVAAQAATAITSERDTGALDLLLVTDLTPGEFIFGKLGGILYNTKEYLLPPLILAGVYAWYGTLARPPAGHPELAASMNLTAFICTVGALIVLELFATVLGVHVALRTPNSRVAVTHALSTIFFLTVGTLICIGLILINGRFEYQWFSFIFFVVAGIGGLWWVLNGSRPSGALTWAAWFCPLGVLYTVMTILVARPGSRETADPLLPFAVIAASFGFAITAMLVPLLSEFDVALGRTTGEGT